MPLQCPMTDGQANAPELIKLCGISTCEAADAAISGGTTHIGFIFFEKSPRNISFAKAANLAAHIGARAETVAVTVNAGDEVLDEIVREVKPSLLQLHGGETPERIQTLKNKYGLPIIKAMAVRDAGDLERAKAFIGAADYLLFDAKAPAGSDLPGGNGVAFDWQVMDLWPEDVPYILSGGLNVDNISEAIEHCGAFGIDVSSGIELEPGVKDIALIEAFLNRIA